MISAFAKGAQILDEPRYADAARARGRVSSGGNCGTKRARMLLRRYRDGECRHRRVSGRLCIPRRWRCSIFMRPVSIAHDLEFAVRAGGAGHRAVRGSRSTADFSARAAGERDLVLRLKDDYDGAEPSGNSGMALALLRLARMTGREDFRAGGRTDAARRSGRA